MFAFNIYTAKFEFPSSQLSSRYVATQANPWTSQQLDRQWLMARYLKTNRRKVIEQPHLVVQCPFVFGHKSVYHLFHGEVRNQLVLSEFNACDRIEMTNSLQMLFNVFPFVCDAGRSDDRLAQDLKADFAAKVVRHVTFL